MTRNNDEMNDDAIDDGQDGNNVNENDGTEVQPLTPQPNPSPVEFANMNDRERALVEKARGEEKRKLYKKQRELEETIKDLRKQMKELQTAPTPRSSDDRQTRDDKLDALLNGINTLAQSQKELSERLDTIQNEEVSRRRRADLDAYSARRVAEIRRGGEDVIEALVGGDSEEEVEDSIKIARAEWMLAVQKDRERNGRSNGGRPQSVTVQTSGRRPSGAPAPVTPGSVEADDHENIDALTSDDAVRSGDYEKHRSKLFGKLRRSYKYGGNQPNA